jgi:signal transduction histidine kinase
MLSVEDNGRGFDPQAVEGGGGLGLTSMRQRAAQLGTELTIRSAPGEGTTIAVHLQKGSQ